MVMASNLFDIVFSLGSKADWRKARPASAPIPNFASLRGTLLAKFGIKGALARSMLSSAALNLNFLQEIAANG
jgi:hypothetical protein